MPFYHFIFTTAERSLQEGNYLKPSKNTQIQLKYSPMFFSYVTITVILSYYVCIITDSLHRRLKTKMSDHYVALKQCFWVFFVCGKNKTKILNCRKQGDGSV